MNICLNCGSGRCGYFGGCSYEREIKYTEAELKAYRLQRINYEAQQVRDAWFVIDGGLFFKLARVNSSRRLRKIKSNIYALIELAENIILFDSKLIPTSVTAKTG